MAKTTSGKPERQTVHKRTNQGGTQAKKSSMNKTQKTSYKKYRGQGR